VSGLRRALIGLAIAGVAIWLVELPMILSSDHVGLRGLYAAVGLFVGWSFIGTGLFAWWRRPANRSGALMVAVGFAFFFKGIEASNNSWLFIVGSVFDNLPIVVFIQLLVSFPTGKIQGWLERCIVAGSYVIGVGLQIVPLLFLDTPDGDLCERCPTNPLLVHANHDLAVGLFNLQELLAIPPIALLALLLVRRWRRTTPAQRNALAPVLWTGGATMGFFLAQFVADLAGFSDAVVEPLDIAALVCLAAMPFAFLTGLLRSRIWRASAVNELVERLGRAPAGGERLRDALAQALEDPTLALAYWIPEQRRYVDASGRRIELPQPGSGRRSVLVERKGEQVAAIVHDEALSDEPELIQTVGAALALALENERLDAALRARVEELRASRARIVKAGDEERRRLERNLHDGAQQHLVSLALNLRLARTKLDKDPEAAGQLIDETIGELAEATDELRELARGIHPAILTDRGLDAALDALAGRAPLPVELRALPGERLPAPIESAAYFVVAEALTNVARYAQASRVVVGVERSNGRVVVEVRDDGVGGADPARGSGLRGLEDRIAALDGRLEVSSPQGDGTVVRAEVPCGS
jgi:signal transduction histidine kinase